MNNKIKCVYREMLCYHCRIEGNETVVVNGSEEIRNVLCPSQWPADEIYIKYRMK
jgi:hypothetical protein